MEVSAGKEENLNGSHRWKKKKQTKTPKTKQAKTLQPPTPKSKQNHPPKTHVKKCSFSVLPPWAVTAAAAQSPGSGSQALLASTPSALPMPHFLWAVEESTRQGWYSFRMWSTPHHINSQLIQADTVCQPPCSAHRTEQPPQSAHLLALTMRVVLGSEMWDGGPQQSMKCFLDLESQESIYSNFPLFSNCNFLLSV